MEVKSVVILQKHGLGDCIFAQGIAQHYMRGGYKVYWPVMQEYIATLKFAYPAINWIHDDWYSRDDQVRWDLLHSLCAPLFHSNTFVGAPYKDVMRAKYDMYNLDWHTWRDHARWNRNIFKERELAEACGIYEGDRYNLISREFGSNPTKSVPIDVNNGNKTVFIKQIEGFSLFDWAMLMQNATEIHFVESSNIYLLEMLELRAESINLYARLPDKNHHNDYSYILEKHKYNLI